MARVPEVLARGPWDANDIHVNWRTDQFDAGEQANAEADRLLQRLKDRGSPSHDGLAARLVGCSVSDGALHLELQPIRWALRLIGGDANGSISSMCVVRSADGQWLAGRRAMWVATWQGRWTLGAGGAVELDENPATTLTRELDEEWSVQPERLSVEGLVRSFGGQAFLVGQAWLAEGVSVTPDSEHDTFAWWPQDPSDWPAEAEPELYGLAGMLK